MSDWQVKMAEQADDENAAYSDWVIENKDELIYQYGDELTDFPESIYEGVLDDDYWEAEKKYIESLTIDDIPNEWLSNKWNEHEEIMMNGDE